MDMKRESLRFDFYKGKLFGVIILLLNLPKGDASSSIWSLWWNYEGVSGPTMWGTMNRDWYMCNRGKNQSPIDIDTKVLLFDPTLKHIEIEGDMVSGTLINNGVDLTFEYNQTKDSLPVNISLGPLSYKYTISEIKLHFGLWDGEGSEHTVDRTSFDGEMHIIAYNSDVYHNLSHAKMSPRGVAIIATFLQTGNLQNTDFETITNISQLILFKGQRARLRNISIANILPNIENYVTYEGSFTQPGCQETVTWVILNKPLTVTKSQRTRMDLAEQPMLIEWKALPGELSSAIQDYKIWHCNVTCDSLTSPSMNIYGGKVQTSYPFTKRQNFRLVQMERSCIQQFQLASLRNLRQRDPNHPRTLMAGNFRPVMPLNRRTVRTNINFKGGCSMAQNMQYQLNSKLTVRK